MAKVQILVVDNRREMDRFIDFPWKVYQGNRFWVPPLKFLTRRLLDPKKHPYWQEAERVLFLAKRGEEVVGRIAGVLDKRYIEFHNEKKGFWGFLECSDDQEAADALFSAVETWMRERGMRSIRGPMSPSFNYEIGLLIEGFDLSPAVLMSYNHSYYARLVESCGYAKEKDLLAFLVLESHAVSRRIERLARFVRRRQDVSIQPLTKRNQDLQIPLLTQLYNDCMSDMWGFVPFSLAEAEELLSHFGRVGDSDLVFSMLYRGEPAGIAIAAPDINPLLKRLNGRIGLQGIIKFLLYRSEVQGLRGCVFGIRKQFRKLGLWLVALGYFDEVAKRKGYRYVEVGWNLEDNESMIQLERECGAKAYKRYRLFGKDL